MPKLGALPLSIPVGVPASGAPPPSRPPGNAPSPTSARRPTSRDALPLDGASASNPERGGAATVSKQRVPDRHADRSDAATRTPARGRSTDRRAVEQRARGQAVGDEAPRERETELESNFAFHTAVETARKLIEEAEHPTPRTHVAGSAPRRFLPAPLTIPGRPATDHSAETNEARPAQGGITAPRVLAATTSTPVALWAWRGDVPLPDRIESSIEIIENGTKTRLHGTGEPMPTATPTVIPAAFPATPSPATPSPATPFPATPSPATRLVRLEKTISDSDQALSPDSTAHQAPKSLLVENPVPVPASLAKGPTISPPVEANRQASSPPPISHTPRARAGSKREQPQGPDAPPRREIDPNQRTASPAIAPDLDTVSGPAIAALRVPKILDSTVDKQVSTYSFQAGYDESSKSTPSPTINPEHTDTSGSSQPAGSRSGGRDGRPQLEQAPSAFSLTERSATAFRKTENTLLTAARLEIRPNAPPLVTELTSTVREGASEKFSTTYPQRTLVNDALIKQQPTTAQGTLGADGAPSNPPAGAPPIGYPFFPMQRRTGLLRESTTADSKGQATEEQAPGAARRDVLFAQGSRSRMGIIGKPTPSDFVESTRPDRLPASALPGHASGSPTNYLESRPAGGEAALSQPAPKPGQGPPPMSRAVTASAPATEGAEAVERFVEMAALQRRSSST